MEYSQLGVHFHNMYVGRPVTGPGLNTPARGPTAAPLKTSNQSHQQQHQPATPRTPRSHPPAPLPTPPQGLSSNAWSRPAAEVESPPDRLQAQSVPATPEPAAESGGNGAAFGGKPDFGWTQPGQHPESVGRGVGPSPAGQSQQQILLPAVLPALARQSLTSQGQAKFRALPSAEAIDALCDMSDGSHHAESAKAASQLHQTAAYQQEMAPSSSLAPVLTNSAAAAYNESADTPSHSGGQAAHINGASVVQHTSSSQYKQGSSMQAHPHTLSSQYEAPESSMPYPQSFRMPSECDSSAYDEGGSSTLIHSISNEEQIMREMLEEGNDDMSCDIVMDSQQHDRDDEGPGSRAEQLNTLELHGILGQHGYMLPDLAGEQEEEEESDGDNDADGDDNDDLDDDEEDEETDEASDKGLFKVLWFQAKSNGLPIIVQLQLAMSRASCDQPDHVLLVAFPHCIWPYMQTSPSICKLSRHCSKLCALVAFAVTIINLYLLWTTTYCIYWQPCSSFASKKVCYICM